MRVASHQTHMVRRESRSTVVSLVAFVIAAPIALLLAGGEYLPLAGPGSLGTRAGWLSAAIGAIVFAGTYVLAVREGGAWAEWRSRLPAVKRGLDLVALTAAFSMLSYFMVIAISQVFQTGFRGLTVDPLGGSVLVGVVAAVVGYFAALIGARVTTTSLGAIAVIVLFMGTVASMVSSPDESWWQLHFSQLGNTAGRTGYRFNLALVITGLVLTVLANYVGRAFETGLRARGVRPGRQVVVLTWLFAGIGMCMMLVGLFTDQGNKPVHVTGAAGMVVLFAVFAFGALYFIPGLPRDLLVFTIAVAAGIIVAILLWIPIGYYNLTGMELVSASLLFAWLFVFVRAVDVYGAAQGVGTGTTDEGSGAAQAGAGLTPGTAGTPSGDGRSAGER